MDVFNVLDEKVKTQLPTSYSKPRKNILFKTKNKLKKFLCKRKLRKYLPARPTLKTQHSNM